MSQADPNDADTAPADATRMPRLDEPVSHGVGWESIGLQIGSEIRSLEELAVTLDGWPDPEAAARRRAFVAGLMLAYSIVVRPVIGNNSSEALRALVDDEGWSYDAALAQVLADVQESSDYWRWDDERRLEYYHRLTRAQRARPDTPLAGKRAAVLAAEYRKGTAPNGKPWTVRTLASEIELSPARVGQMLTAAGVQADHLDD